MKTFIALSLLLAFSANLKAQTADTTSAKDKHLFIDVHQLGKVKFEDVAAAHSKDLSVQGKYGVQFIKYWVDEKEGRVYCLSSAKDSASIAATHGEAHGLLPMEVHLVNEGQAALASKGKNYFLDVHILGPGNVTAAEVAKAHEKDLAVQKKYGVHFINYWVDEKKGLVYCLSQASNPSKVVATHKEAHGLLPDYVEKVEQGQ